MHNVATRRDCGRGVERVAFTRNIYIYNARTSHTIQHNIYILLNTQLLRAIGKRNEVNAAAVGCEAIARSQQSPRTQNYFGASD